MLPVVLKLVIEFFFASAAFAASDGHVETEATTIFDQARQRSPAIDVRATLCAARAFAMILVATADQQIEWQQYRQSVQQQQAAASEFQMSNE